MAGEPKEKDFIAAENIETGMIIANTWEDAWLEIKSLTYDKAEGRIELVGTDVNTGQRGVIIAHPGDVRTQGFF